MKRILASGTSVFVGEVDASTILEYPFKPGGDISRLDLEYKILNILGQHPRIIGYKGVTASGLFLERAANGIIYTYLTGSGQPTPFLQQRVAWCREVTEAVDYVHLKKVIHCDIQPTNILMKIFTSSSPTFREIIS